METTRKKGAARRGFTILELLVVIGIIGILAAVAMTQFGGASESAKATQCQTNMRNLTVAMISQAQASEWGEFPAAESYKWVERKNRQVVYNTHKGWVSWGECGDSTTPSQGQLITFSEQSERLQRWALTNGAIWRAVGGAASSYVCPVHADACNKKGRYRPLWSYFVNKDFGWNSNGGNAVTKRSVKSISGLVNADKTLLFAEIQGLEDKEHGLVPNTDGSGKLGDGALDYNTEVVGFNHRTSRGICGHVSFADGHVETLRFPTRGGISLQDLTKALCQGHAVKFNGKGYEDLSK